MSSPLLPPQGSPRTSGNGVEGAGTGGFDPLAATPPPPPPLPAPAAMRASGERQFLYIQVLLQIFAGVIFFLLLASCLSSCRALLGPFSVSVFVTQKHVELFLPAGSCSGCFRLVQRLLAPCEVLYTIRQTSVDTTLHGEGIRLPRVLRCGTSLLGHLR